MNKALLTMDPGLNRVASGLSPDKCWSRFTDREGAEGKRGQVDGDNGDDTSSEIRRIRLGIVLERRGTVCHTTTCMCADNIRGGWIIAGGNYIITCYLLTGRKKCGVVIIYCMESFECSVPPLCSRRGQGNDVCTGSSRT